LATENKDEPAIDSVLARLMEKPALEPDADYKDNHRYMVNNDDEELVQALEDGMVEVLNRIHEGRITANTIPDIPIVIHAVLNLAQHLSRLQLGLESPG